MSTAERVDKDIAGAMRAKEKARLSALRLLKAALVNRRVEKGRELDETEAQQVITTMVKQRREAIEQFSRGGRQDLVDKETAEITVLESYLPPPIDAAQLDQIVSAAIQEAEATSVRDLGRVMKIAMARLSGQLIDGRTVNDLVRKKLGG